MNIFQNLQTITIILGIFGVIFGIYKGIKDPQIKNEIAEALIKKELEIQNKWVAEQFYGVNSAIKTLMDNHIHTLYEQQKSLQDQMYAVSTKLAVLTNTIEERIPKLK